MCHQMARLSTQYLAIYKCENLPNMIKNYKVGSNIYYLNPHCNRIAKHFRN